VLWVWALPSRPYAALAISPAHVSASINYQNLLP